MGAGYPGKIAFEKYQINLAFSWMHLLRGAYAEAFPYLERLQEFWVIPKKEFS